MLRLTCGGSVLGFWVGGLDFSILGDDGVAFASVVAHDGGGVELHVDCAGKIAGGVGEEADAAALVGVEVFGPGFHATGKLVSASEVSSQGQRFQAG